MNFLNFLTTEDTEITETYMATNQIGPLSFGLETSVISVPSVAKAFEIKVFMDSISIFVAELFPFFPIFQLRAVYFRTASVQKKPMQIFPDLQEGIFPKIRPNHFLALSRIGCDHFPFRI